MSYFMMQNSSQYTRRTACTTSDESMATHMAGNNRWESSGVHRQQSQMSLAQQGYQNHYNSSHYPHSRSNNNCPAPLPPCGPINEDHSSCNGYTPGRPMKYVFKGRSSGRSSNHHHHFVGGRRRRGGGQQEQDCIDYRPYPSSSYDNESCTSTVISAITLPESLASVPEADALQKFCVRRKSGDADQDVRPRRPRRSTSMIHDEDNTGFDQRPSGMRSRAA